MTKFKDMCVKFIFDGALTQAQFQEILRFIRRKREVCRLSSMGGNFLYEFLRCLKYTPLEFGAHKVCVTDDFNVSIPYFGSEGKQLGVDIAFYSLQELKLPFFTSLVNFFRLAVFAAYSVLLDRNVRPYNLSSVFIGYIWSRRIAEQNQKTVNFYGYSSFLGVNALAYFLTLDSKLTLIFHENASFIDEEHSIHSNVIVYNNEIARNIAFAHPSSFVADKFEFKTSLSQLKDGMAPRVSAKTLGYYSEGYYARGFSYYSKEIICKGRAIERELLGFLLEFAKENREIELVIFPHYHRGVESFDRVCLFYKDLLQLSNVRLNSPTLSSSESFCEIDLGIVIRSNIYWDRLVNGYHTLLISPFFELDYEKHSDIFSPVLDVKDPNFAQKFNSEVNKFN